MSEPKKTLKAPSLRKEYPSESDLMEDVQLNFEFFKDIFIQVNQDFDKLSNLKKGFPTKYVEHDDFEDLIIKASQAKHLALNTNKVARGISEELDTKLEYFMAHIQIYIADDALKNLNFAKITDSTREAYINTKKEIAEMKIMKSRFNALAIGLDKLVKMFEYDEGNFRRFLEKKDNLKGLK